MHLPDPSYDDDPDIARAHRDRILSYVSLERVTDPIFDCKVVPSDASEDCEFCPRKDGMPYRQFTCMPYTNSVACGGFTPLSHTMWNAYDYYRSYFDQDLMSQYLCRDNYIILFTDGRSNCWDKIGNDREDPVKAAHALNNLIWHEGQSDATMISVKTYVMGFGLDDESKTLCDAIAVAGDTDHAYFVTTVDDIVDALRMIFGVAQDNDEEDEPEPCRMYTRSDPVIVGKDAVYTGLFEYPSWRGHLNKYTLVENWWREESENWYAEDLTWYDSGSTEESDYSLDGDAGAKLDQRGADSRVIFTADSSGKIQDFTSSAAGNSADQKGTLENAGLDIIGFDSGAELVNKIRNMDYEEGDCYEETGGSWKLGDIYHSTPVIVGKPLREELDSFADRPHLVLIGANDGMLHAFDDSDGTELWSYIPNCLLGKLHNLKDGQHTYCVDLDAKATDVEFDSGWRTVLVGGLREGGNHYFALDITDTEKPEPLWEVTHAHMGQTWSTPSFGRIPGDQYVAFVGGGYDSGDNVGSSFYVIDFQTGDFVKTFTGFADKDEDFPAQVRAVDLDRDGYIERVYFTSTKGKLYRLRIDPKTGVEDTVSMIFDPGDYEYYAKEKIAGLPEEQDITKIVPYEAVLPVDTKTMRRPSYYAPSVMRTEYLPRNYIIHYGTGDEQSVIDTWGQDFFFEIEDRESEAVCKWVYVFEPGEKCLSRPMTFDHIVYFTTYHPGICTSGEGFIYGLTATSRLKPRGDAGIKYDLSGKRLSTKKCKIGGIVGIPSSPQVANGAVIGNSSRQPTHLWRLKIDELYDRIRSWQEVF